MATYHMTAVSANTKTGPIPITTTSRDTCPDSCPFRGAGCYAENYPLRLHWDQVTAGARGGSLRDLCRDISRLPTGQLWRHNQAGDLPHEGGQIDRDAVRRITRANRGKRGFTYTHHDPTTGQNAETIAEANGKGFTVNLSANDLRHADELAALNVGPVVVVLPSDHADKVTRTPKGRRVVRCPATYREHGALSSCATCGLCQRQDRDYIIGFPAHGTRRKVASKRAALPVLS